MIQTPVPYSKCLDFASVDDNKIPDDAIPEFFARVYALGYRVVTIRASFCYYDPSHQAWRLAADPDYQKYATAARAAGLVVQAYYFAIFAKGAPAPTAQFANFLAVVGSNVIAGVDLPPCVDFEWQSFRNLLQSPGDVAKLLVEHVSLIRGHYGCACVYTSQNEFYDLNYPAIPEISDAMLWVKTAYPVGAGKPPYSGPIMDAHVMPSPQDPHEYFAIPKPWGSTGARMQQTQGDARFDVVLGDGRVVHIQADLSRFRRSAPGSSGPEVSDLQRRLAARGHKVTVNGSYDTPTEAAVRSEQAAGGLVVDADVGAKTFARVSWPRPATGTMA